MTRRKTSTSAFGGSSRWENDGKAPERLPTHEEIGQLYLLATELRSYGASLTEFAWKLIGRDTSYQAYLARLDILREEVTRFGPRKKVSDA